MAIDGDRPAVDLSRLVALVRVRRVVRLGAWLAVLALPTWLIVLGIGLDSSTEDSPTWNWFNDRGNRGFVIVLVVLALDLVVALGVRGFGDAGRLAARLVPMVRRDPDPVVRDRGSRGETRLLDLGGRTSRMPKGSWVAIVVLSVMLAAFAVFGLLAGTRIHAQYRASHGHGGPVVTLGTNSHIIRRVQDFNENVRTGHDYTYYVSSPRGEAAVEGGSRPGSGTKLAITRADGGLRAVHVGGYSWVTSLVITVVSALFGCLTVFFLARRVRARAPDRRVVPLARTLERLAEGGRVAVQPTPHGRSAPGGRAVPLTTTAGRTSAELRRAALVAGTGVLALLVAGGVVAALA